MTEQPINMTQGPPKEASRHEKMINGANGFFTTPPKIVPTKLELLICYFISQAALMLLDSGRFNLHREIQTRFNICSIMMPMH